MNHILTWKEYKDRYSNIEKSLTPENCLYYLDRLNIDAKALIEFSFGKYGTKQYHILMGKLRYIHHKKLNVTRFAIKMRVISCKDLSRMNQRIA